MNLRLHPDKGVNARLTFCPRCGGDGLDLLLIGANDMVTTCRVCGAVSYGERKCLKCGERTAVDTRQLEEHEKLPGSLCPACEAENAIIAQGGVYWRCADCKASGIIKPSLFAEQVRAAHNLPAPAPCGVEFTRAEGCPVCGGSEESEEDS